jgi:hypothetical protein
VPQDLRQRLLALDEHDTADARRPARDALCDVDDLRSVLPISHPDAVVSGAELVPYLSDFCLDAQAREGAEDQGGSLVVAVAGGAPGLPIRRQLDYGEAEGALVGDGRPPPELRTSTE